MCLIDLEELCKRLIRPALASWYNFVLHRARQSRWDSDFVTLWNRVTLFVQVTANCWMSKFVQVRKLTQGVRETYHCKVPALNSDQELVSRLCSLWERVFLATKLLNKWLQHCLLRVLSSLEDLVTSMPMPRFADERMVRIA